MPDKRLIGLGVVIVLLLVLSVGSGLAAGAVAEGAGRIIIYNPVPGVFDAVVESFVQQMAANLAYDSADQLDVTVVTNGDELAAALDQGADVIFSVPGGAVLGAGVDLGAVPVIFALSFDPVGEGLVQSLEMPGGSVTGVMLDDSTARRFELLLDLVPDVKAVYILVDEGASTDPLTVIEPVVADTGIALTVADVKLAEGIGDLPADIDAIFLVTAPFTPLAADLPLAAMEAGLPLVTDSAVILTSPYGPVLAFGPDMTALGAQAADLAAQILLAGANPGELPVEAAAPFLTIDLRMADQIGLEVSDSMLMRADQILTVENAGELPAPGGDMATPGELGACNATLIHPGGSNTVCLNVPCDVPLDAGFIRYEDRVPVETCDTEALIGTCAMEAFDMLHYDGEISAVKRGCLMLQGEWHDPATDEAPADAAAEDAAADDTATDDGSAASDAAAELGACNATLIHPGGSNMVCLNVACDVPLDAGFIRYEDRVPVETCDTEALIGTCSMEAFDMLHYDGEISAVKRGCLMLQGEWHDPE